MAIIMSVDMAYEDWGGGIKMSWRKIPCLITLLKPFFSPVLVKDGPLICFLSQGEQN